MVTLGHVELPSDFAGRQYVRLDRTAAPLNGARAGAARDCVMFVRYARTNITQ